MDSQLTKLILNVQSGDESSFAKLRAQYEGLLHSLVSQMIAKLPEAEFDDLMQEATLALYHALMRFDTQQKDVTFGLYAKICIRNRLISVARRYGKKSFDAQKTRSVDLSANERKAARRVAYRDLDQIAQTTLSSFEYAVYQLYLEGYSINEMAKQMERSPKSIDNAVYRMRKKIKVNLEPASPSSTQ